jgi:hypothetical protein
LQVGRGAAAILPIGEELLVVGGVIDTNQIAATAERIRINDLASCNADIVYTLESMATPRAEARLAPLLGGDVLVSGGFTVASGKVISLGQGEFYVRPR